MCLVNIRKGGVRHSLSPWGEFLFQKWVFGPTASHHLIALQNRSLTQAKIRGSLAADKTHSVFR